MTRYGDRDAAGRLPTAPPGGPPCGQVLAFAPEVTCQGEPGHPLPCRHYDPQAGRFEWWPQEPWPLVRVSRP